MKTKSDILRETFGDRVIEVPPCPSIPIEDLLGLPKIRRVTPIHHILTPIGCVLLAACFIALAPIALVLPNWVREVVQDAFRQLYD